jgi:asparagine N-glycosylation enzyme membrane subunit Stt3
MLPLGLAAAVDAGEHANRFGVGFYQITAHGDLFAISGVLVLAGLGELLLSTWGISGNSAPNIAIPATLMAVVAACSSALYAVSYAHYAGGGQAGNAWIADGSTVMLALAAIVTSIGARNAGKGEL